MTRANRTPEPEFIPCTLKELPPDQLVLAADTARVWNPKNAPPMNLGSLSLGPDHLAVLTTKYWGSQGVKLSVGFMESTPDNLRERILSHMNAWGEYCNVEFAWTQTDPQVRITREQQGYWSYLGTDVLHIPRNQATMCLQGFTMQTSEKEYRRVVRHETGHTLGFPHEHMRGAIIERLDVAKTIEYFRRTQGWSATQTRQQVLSPLSEGSIRGTPMADDESIMCYQLPASITKDGRPILGGDDINDIDADWVAKIYPKTDEPDKLAGLELRMDFDKKLVTMKLPAGWRVTKG